MLLILPCREEQLPDSQPATWQTPFFWRSAGLGDTCTRGKRLIEAACATPVLSSSCGQRLSSGREPAGRGWGLSLGKCHASWLPAVAGALMQSPRQFAHCPHAHTLLGQTGARLRALNAQASALKKEMITKLWQVIYLISSCSFPQSRDYQLEGVGVPAEISHVFERKIWGWAHPRLPYSRYPRPVSQEAGEGTAGRTCCLVGCSNGCWSPFLDTNLHHIGILLFATYLHSQEQQSPASTPSCLFGLPTPLLTDPIPPAAMREAQSQIQPTANTKSRLSALPFYVTIHLVTEPLDAFPVFLRDTWVSGLILQRKKKERKKEKTSLSARCVQASGTRQEAAQTSHCCQLH